MTYFVTGATGFIGRHLVERLLEREGDIHVLVREGSADKLERWRGEERVKPVFGDLAQPQLGIDDAAREQLQGVDHFFHLAAIYDITADETQNALLNVGGTQNAVDLANALGAKRFHHMSSIAVAGDYDGWFTEDNFDEGQSYPTPYHRTKFESEKLVRERVQVPWRVYRPSIVVGNSQDRRDGQDRRPLLLLQGDPEAAVRAAAVVPDRLAGVRAHQPRAGRLRRRGGRPHLPPGRARRSGLPRRRPQAAEVRRRAERLRERRARAARRHAGRQEGHRHAAEGRPLVRPEDPRAAGDQAQLPGRLRHPRGGAPERRARDEVRRPRRPARARRLGDRAARARDLRRQAVGLLGAQPRPGPVQGPLVRGRRQRQDRRHHRRVERHRPRRRAQDRRGRRDPAARRPHGGEAPGGQDGDRGQGRDRLRLSVRPVRLRRDRAARRADARRPPGDRRAHQQRRAARSGARSSSPTTASTTTSAPSSSTT